ncbi:DUF4430 domain-containing protein [Vagococcus fluvialis]|uniref:DUF4430 domain-containing protein n=1 Tax=Vagococcus fluvialis TaxID=2738 RepID=UPI0032E457A1
MKKLILGFVLSSFLMVGTACSTNTEKTTFQSSTEQKQGELHLTLSLVEDEKEFATKEVTAKDSDTVLEILKANFDVKEDGGFVTSIDGKEQDPKANKYWMYYINDKEADKGASEMTVSDSDKIEWRLNEFK